MAYKSAVRMIENLDFYAETKTVKSPNGKDVKLAILREEGSKRFRVCELCPEEELFLVLGQLASTRDGDAESPDWGVAELIILLKDLGVEFFQASKEKLLNEWAACYVLGVDDEN